MAAANKKDPAKKRTLMMGEIWAKLASKYAKALDVPNFKEIFEPIQAAVGARGGPERVLQAIQAAVELHPTNIVLHADVVDAYPSLDRGLMLQAVYSDEKLRHMWRSFDFNFSQPSVVLVRVGDRVVHSSISDNGVPQGNVLSSVGFAKAVHSAYLSAEGKEAGSVVKLRAAMDDVTAVGGVVEILSCYDRLSEALALLGCNISLVKTKFQVPVGCASEELLVGASNRGIEVVHGNVPALGGMIGCNDEEFEVFLLNELASYDPLLKAIRDPALPAALALYYSTQTRASNAEPSHPDYAGPHVCV